MATLNQDNTNARMRHKLHPSSLPRTPKPLRQHRVPKHKKQFVSRRQAARSENKELQKLTQQLLHPQEAHDSVYDQESMFRSLPRPLRSTASRGKGTYAAVARGELWFTAVRYLYGALGVWVA